MLSTEPTGVFGVSETDIEEASQKEGFDDAGSLTFPPEVDFIEFSTEELLKRLRPFMQKKAISRDIITRSLQIKTDDNPNIVFFNATDSISFLTCALNVKNNHFPNGLLIDIESFSVVAKTHKHKTFLIHRNGSVYANFYGGEIFIPTYRLNPTVFDFNQGKVIHEGKLDISALKAALESMAPVVSSSEVADLCYIFVEDDGVYATNGTVVAKYISSMQPFKVRQVDVNLLVYMLDSIQNEAVKVLETESFYCIDAETFSYAFPKATPVLSKSYKEVYSKPKGRYFVNLPYLNAIIGVLAQMPESSGVVEMAFGENLTGTTKTRQGNESTFIISNSKEGAPEAGKFGIAVKALMIVTRVFKGEPSVSIYSQDGKVVIGSENRECAIILKKG